MAGRIDRNAFSDARKSSLLTQQEMGKEMGLSTATIVEREKHPEKLTIEEAVKWYGIVGTDGKERVRDYVLSFFCCRIVMYYYYSVQKKVPNRVCGARGHDGEKAPRCSAGPVENGETILDKDIIQQKTTSVSYMSVSDVAKLLGISVQAVYTIIHRDVDPLPHVDIGTGGRPFMRISSEDLEEWLESNRHG